MTDNNWYDLERAVILDSNVLEPKDKCLGRQIYALSNDHLHPEVVTLDTHFDRLKRVSWMSYTFLIKEVKEEIDQFTRVLQKTCHPRFTRGRHAVDWGHKFGEVKDYIDGINEFLEDFNYRPKPNSLFSDGQACIYELALRLAEEADAGKIEERYGKPTLGWLLNTDNKLVATSIAMSYATPTILLTEDRRLRNKCTKIRSKVAKISGGIVPSHPIVPLRLEDYYSL